MQMSNAGDTELQAWTKSDAICSNLKLVKRSVDINTHSHLLLPHLSS